MPETEDKPIFFLNIPQSPDSCLALPCQHLKFKVRSALISATNHPAGEQPRGHVAEVRDRHGWHRLPGPGL